MIKQGDKVLVVRLENKQRPTTVEERAGDSFLGSFTTTKPVVVKRKAVIGSLGRLFITVLLPDRKIRKILYPDLTFTKAGVSFKSKKADWKGIDPKTHKEVLRPGKPITIKGKAVLRGLYIPVVINGEKEVTQVPYEQLRFKKETKE